MCSCCIHAKHGYSINLNDASENLSPANGSILVTKSTRATTKRYKSKHQLDTNTYTTKHFGVDLFAAHIFHRSSVLV